MQPSDGLVRGLVEASPDGLWLIDVEGRTLWANQRLASLVGRSLEEMPAVTPYDIVDEQGRQDWDAHLERMRSHHPGGHNEEVLVLRPDGSTVWALASWSPLYDDDRLIGYLHRLTEYTERRRLVGQLRQRERELAEAQRIAQLGSWHWNLVDNAIWWSPELSRVFGMPDDRQGHQIEDFLELLAPEDREPVSSQVRAALEQRDTLRWEGRIVRPVDGATRWVRSLGIVERDAQGRAVQMTGTVQDITDLRSAGEAAAAATARFELLMRLAEAANRSSTLSDALVRAAHVVGEHSDWDPLCVFVRPGRGQPLTARELPEPTTHDLPRPSPTRAQACWESGLVDVWPLPDDPGHSIVSLPVRNDRGLACVVQLYTDSPEPDAALWALIHQIADQLSRVAERERVATQLAEARDEAMAASRHKSEFLATMSHEIRTPMNGVIGLTDLLARTDLDDRQHRLVEGLRGAGLTLLALINDILDLSKIESGRLELEETDFEVRTVLDDAVTVVSGPAREKGLELVVSCDPAVPRTVAGDPVRFGQVLTNLASNAVKFTDAGEVVIEVGLEPGSATPDPALPGAPPADGPASEAEEVWLRCEVRDTGIGIPPQQVDRLFDAFTQADRSTTRRHGGTGLGLAISRRLVEQMGGTIGGRSTPGAGSVFWFTARLRAACGDAGADGGGAGDTDTRGLGSPLGDRRRVLVVDDHPTAADAAVRQLAGWNLAADTEASAEAARTRLMSAAHAGTPYDAVLVDLEVPEVGGLALGRSLRAEPALAGLDLVLLARDAGLHEEEVTEAGYQAWVAKPVRASELYDALVTAGDGPAKAPARPRRRPPTHDLGLRVLVVEDNPVNQLVATGMLEGLGCRVVTVANGEEAVDALAPGHDFDVVLMDCRMPRLDGYDATRAVRRNEGERRVPIVAMTASALPGERDRCLDAGMDDFLTKPIDAVQLTQTLTRVTTLRTPAPSLPTSEPAGSSDLVLDPERVAMLGELVKDGVSFFERTRMSFLSRIDGTLSELRIAADDNNLARLRAIAHRLKGSALNLGLNRVGAAASALEQLDGDRDETTAALPGMVAEITTEVTSAVDALASVQPPQRDG